MNMHLIWGVIVVFGTYFTRADVHELQMNERAYLPPDNKEYLPPSEKEVKEEVVNSLCNLPMIVYNGPPPPVKVKSKLNNEYLPPSKEEGKVLATKINNQPKVANDPLPISPKLQQKHIIQEPKPKPTKILDNNNLTMKPKKIVNREYLPPSNDNTQIKAIPQGYQHNQPKAIPDPLPINQEQAKKTMNGLSYQHNQPKAIDDPLPIKVNYIQPLRLDFLDGQLKPIAKGPLFTGLFLNASEIKLSTERLPKKIRINQTQAIKVKQNLKPLAYAVNKTNPTKGKEAQSQTKDVNYELKTEHSLQNKKYHKKFEDDIVLINYPDATTNFKLFNSDDDTLLSGSAPEVIFKPGDDISFVHDTSIIDNYEHMPIKAKKAEMITTTSRTPIPVPEEAYTTQNQNQDQAALAAHEQEQPNEAVSNVADHGYSYKKPKYEPLQEQTTEALIRQSEQKDAQAALKQVLTNETEGSVTDLGYSYEKPKYESIQEQTTEALRIHADEQDVQAALKQEQSNKTESSVTDHGYSYEKPKYESIQEQTTEALRRQADECGTSELKQPHTEIKENKPHNGEQPISEDDVTNAKHQSNENDHSYTGAGYFYEKPKIPFDF